QARTPLRDRARTRRPSPRASRRTLYRRGAPSSRFPAHHGRPTLLHDRQQPRRRAHAGARPPLRVRQAPATRPAESKERLARASLQRARIPGAVPAGLTPHPAFMFHTTRGATLSIARRISATAALATGVVLLAAAFAAAGSRP